MDFQIQFAHPWVLYITLPVILLLWWYRFFRYEPLQYRYPLTRWLSERVPQQGVWISRVMLACRALTLLVLGVLIAKPQIVDIRSQVNVEGIAIALVLDVSDSMRCFDDLRDQTPRLEIAKREAVRFINKRTDDPIALVIFGAEAVSRVPLTMDKMLLRSVIDQLVVGVVPQNGTVLSKAMLIACARLKQATAKSKIMIVLTDGQPTVGDMPPQAAVALAKSLGIKIYTIGIGDVGYMLHPLMGPVPVGSQLNRELLHAIAQATGGQFFEARKPQELRHIYDEIDKLERTVIETPIFQNVYDWFIPGVWVCILLLLLELLMGVVWRVL